MTWVRQHSTHPTVAINYIIISDITSLSLSLSLDSTVDIKERAFSEGQVGVQYV